MTTNISIIILAAGASRRMGQPKQLLQLEEESLVRRATKTALKVVGVKNVIVVLGANRDLIEKEIADLNCRNVFNKDWDSGMGTSLKVGMEEALQCYENLDACLVMLADQPFLQTIHLEQLIKAFAKSGLSEIEGSPAPIIAAQYKDRLGVPAIIPSFLFPSLLSLNEDQGARSIINANNNITKSIDLSDLLFDIDTPADYEEAKNRMKSER